VDNEPDKANTTTAGRANPERTALGALAIVAICAGVWGMITSEGPGWPGITLRSGIILAAIWIALPNLRRLRPATWYAMAAPTFVLLARPRLILWGLALGAAIWVANRRLGRPMSSRTGQATGGGRGERPGPGAAS
jgi:hypothetical protein